MTDLDAVRDAYLTLHACYAVTGSLVSKSTKGVTFHGTIFLGQPPEEAKRRLAMAKSDLDDWAIVALLSVFERILFEHPKSLLCNKTQREGARGLDSDVFKLNCVHRVTVTHVVARRCMFSWSKSAP